VARLKTNSTVRSRPDQRWGSHHCSSGQLCQSCRGHQCRLQCRDASLAAYACKPCTCTCRCVLLNVRGSLSFRPLHWLTQDLPDWRSMCGTCHMAC